MIWSVRQERLNTMMMKTVTMMRKMHRKMTKTKDLREEVDKDHPEEVATLIVIER